MFLGKVFLNSSIQNDKNPFILPDLNPGMNNKNFKMKFHYLMLRFEI